MKIKREVLNNIEYVLGNASIESGGIIGGKDSIVTNFYFDINAKRNDKMYIPNVESLNEVISDWAKQKILFYGVVHSHPNGQYQLSAKDIIYANKIITLFPSLEKNIYFPIITTNPTRFYSYRFDKGRWVKDNIILQN